MTVNAAGFNGGKSQASAVQKNKKTKMPEYLQNKIYKVVVCPVLQSTMLGCEKETWTGSPLYYGDDPLKKLDVALIVEKVREVRLWWYGHVMWSYCCENGSQIWLRRTLTMHKTWEVVDQ